MVLFPLALCLLPPEVAQVFWKQHSQLELIE